MTTSYIETKMEEFEKEFNVSKEVDKLMLDSRLAQLYCKELKNDYRKHLESALTDLLSKAKEAVPKEAESFQDIPLRKGVCYYEESEVVDGFNYCREQTLTNLSKLQDNN